MCPTIYLGYLMGIYDRDYYRPQPRWGERMGLPKSGFIKPLVFALAGVFFLQVLTSPRDPFSLILALDPSKVRDGEIWRLVSYGFVHSTKDPLHILMNGLVIWFFGIMLEGEISPTKVAKIFLSATLCGGLVFCALVWLGFRPTPSLCVGASGGATALMVTAAWRNPKLSILLFFVLPVPLWFATVLFVAFDLFLFLQGNSIVAVEVHLAGAAVATFWVWSSHANPFPTGYFRNLKRSVVGPKLRLFQNEGENKKKTDPQSKKAQPKKVAILTAAKPSSMKSENEMDRILEKISFSGMQSLTDEEKRFLLSESARLKSERGN